MLKHSRKFKLVPVGEEEPDYAPPTPPMLKKLGKLDQELRDILEDATLSETEKMQRYEYTLMKWGKFYRQYQSSESGGRDNTSLNNTIGTVATPTFTTTTTATPSIWHSTPKTILFAPSSSRDRSRSPLSSRSSSPVDYFTTPSTVKKKKKKYKTERKQKPLTPPQAARQSQRLKARTVYNPYQTGTSWLPWRLNTRKRRRE